MCLLPVAAQAQFTFTTNSGALTLTGYSGTSAAVIVPSSTNGLPVTRFGQYAFANNPSVVSITIPSSVTNYHYLAFNNCSNLRAIFFQGVAPVSSAPAGPPVFSGVNNTTLYHVQGASGWGSSIDGLPAVLWDPLVLGQLTYVTNGGAITITGYTGPGGLVVVPSVITGRPVVNIAAQAFWNSSALTGMTLPNSITNVGDRAFAGCAALTGVTLPPGTVGSGIFSNCTSLTSLTLPDGLGILGVSEFSGCTALTSVTIPGSVTNMGDWTFENCSNLTGVYFQGNAPIAALTVYSGANNVTNYYFLKSSGWGATLAGRPTAPILFTCTTNGGAITISKYIGIGGSVTVPDTLNGLPVRTIGNSAFYACGTLTNIDIGSNVTAIAGQAFVGCSNLLSINVSPLNPIHSSLDGVLFDKNRTRLLYYPGGRPGSYAIPSGVTNLPSYSFQDCFGLTSLTVPGSVTSIDTLAFSLDPALTAIYFEGDAPTAAWWSFYPAPPATVFYMPGTAGWTDYLDVLLTSPRLPMVRINDGSFGVQSNQFGFNIGWSNGATVIVDACTNLSEGLWIPVQTNTFIGSTFFFSDPAWTNFPGRYYRVRSP
jgi:hypothetical protein